MTAVLLDRPASWQGQIKAQVAKFDGCDVDVLDTRDGRILVRKHELVRPSEIVVCRHNLLVNAGIQRALDQLIGATSAPYNAANSRIGVGDDSTAASASQSDLQAGAGSTHRQFEVMDATYPSRSSQTVTWRSTYTTGEANFAWAEWCIDIGTIAGTTVVAPMLNRKVASLGTKVNTAVWQFTVTLTLS